MIELSWDIDLEACFKLSRITLKVAKYCVVDTQLGKLLNIGDVYF